MIILKSYIVNDVAASSTGGASIQFQDEGVNLGNNQANIVDFVGPSVVATRTLDKITVTISGGGGLTSFTVGNLSPLFTASLGGDPLDNPALTFALVNQNPNLVYAGPASGADADPTFRALVPLDIPDLSGTYYLASNPAGYITSITGAWLLASGGALTGANTISGAFNIGFTNTAVGIGVAPGSITAGVKTQIRGAGSTTGFGLVIESSVGTDTFAFRDDGKMYHYAIPVASTDSSDILLLRDDSDGEIKSLGIGSGLGISGGNLVNTGSVSDGDKGDITVSAGGTVWTIDADIAKIWTGAHRFLNNNFRLLNPAQTFNYTFITSAIAATRTVTLPILTGNDTFVFEDHIQTLTNKTLGTGTIVILGSDATGDLYINGGSGVLTRLAAGATPGHVLTSNGSGVAPSYQASSGLTFQQGFAISSLRL